MILYPTETIYALGVNPFDRNELEKLYVLKGRDAEKAVSWLVREIADIERYAIMSEKAAKIAERFLPGQLTIVLPLRVPQVGVSGEMQTTIGFRVSTDPVAQACIEKFMKEHNAPLTCTSANRSGQPTMSTVEEIESQFGDQASLIHEVIDDGPRSGVPTTVVRVVDEIVDVLREGRIKREEILEI